MVYGTIEQVRELAGIKPEFAHKVPLKKADGVTAVFEVPAVGRNKGFFVDLTDGQSSTITIADVVVYDDGVSVTVASIDQDAGTVTLSLVPALDSIMTIDYKYSKISDANVIEAMDIAEEITDIEIGGKGSAGNAFTQTEDGDGYETDFTLEHSDVTSITSVTVEGTVQTADTDYFTYTYRGSAHISEIKLLSPAPNIHKTLVIVYEHGSTSDLIDRLSNLFAARHILLQIARINPSVRNVKGSGKEPSRSSNFALLQAVNNEINNIRTYVSHRRMD